MSEQSNTSDVTSQSGEGTAPKGGVGMKKTPADSETSGNNSTNTESKEARGARLAQEEPDFMKVKPGNEPRIFTQLQERIKQGLGGWP